jgi:hypothetical protein
MAETTIRPRDAAGTPEPHIGGGQYPFWPILDTRKAVG